MEPQHENYLNKEQVQTQFDKLFLIDSNNSCFQCGKKGRHWVDKNHAVFLCLTCAALYRQLNLITSIRSINLDVWLKEDIQILAKAGNQRFKDFLTKYDLHTATFKQKLRTKAAQYYRIMLQQEAKGHLIPPQPSIEIGRQHYKASVSLTDMSSDEIIEEVKQKAVWFGSKTKQLGGKAYDKVHHKVVSGELKKDVKEAAHKVSTNASKLWGILSNKVSEIKSKYYDNEATAQKKQQVEKPKEAQTLKQEP